MRRSDGPPSSSDFFSGATPVAWQKSSWWTRYSAVGANSSVVTLDNYERAPTDLRRLDRCHVQSEMRGDARTERLVLDGAGERRDLRLENVC